MIIKVGRVLAKQVDAGGTVIVSSQRRGNHGDLFQHKGEWYSLTEVKVLHVGTVKKWAHHFQKATRGLVFHVHQYDKTGWCHCGIGREISLSEIEAND